MVDCQELKELAEYSQGWYDRLPKEMREQVMIYGSAPRVGETPEDYRTRMEKYLQDDRDDRESFLTAMG
jgi:hypothetical protein